MPLPMVLSKRNNSMVAGIYVGRPTKFGNPFTIGKDGSRDEVIAKYSSYLESNPNLKEAAKVELKG